MLLRKLKPKAEGSGGCGAITAIAIDKDKNSQHALRWAVENIIPADSPHCVLLHVKHKSGETKEEEDKKEAYRFFIPFRGFCGRKGIRAKEVLLHHHDISTAIAKYLADDCIANVVVGASAHNSLFKKFMHTDLAANLLKNAPETCAVFVISKGKLITSRSANHPRTPRSPHAQKSRAVHFGETGRTSSIRSRELVQSAQHDTPRSSPSQSDQSNNSPSANSQWEIGCDFSRYDSMASTETSYSILEYSTTYGSSSTSLSSMSISEMDDMQDSSWEHQNQSLEREIRRLRLQLQALNSALGREAMTATENALDLRERREAETRKLEEARQEAETPRAPSVVELQKSQAAIQAAEMAQRLAEMESQKKKLIEMQAKLEEEQKTSADYRLSENRVSYRRYSIKEIEDATVCFSDALKIGEGGYGPVYKAVLDHTAVAIKILKSDVSQGLKQFHQEIEVLSCIRHPNMVILLGACPEYGCLVYEYMENGTLEDRLFCKDDSPPLTWRSRFRIAAEIATGLLFLHQAKPEPLVHRDLKPANILLDRHFVSKISDVGLARLVPSSVTENFSQYHMTAAAGTFCYIDPEYQQTGMLGVKSDLYSFGVVLLQIITARPPIGLSHKVEQAIDTESFREILDPNIQDWPIKETLALAKMALQCCELRKKDRPDLASGLLPLLNRLRDLALEDHEPDSDRTLHST